MADNNNPFALVSNPLDLDVILAKVLDYVGGHKKSLLNCRLVNQRWNSMVLLKLRKENNTIISLDTSNIIEYFELAQFTKQTSASLPLSVRLQAYIDDNQDQYDAFINGVTSLLKLFGPSCIKKIQISTGTGIDMESFEFDWKLMLDKVITPSSPGLETLELKPYRRDEFRNYFDYLTQDISFPSLQILSYWGTAKNHILLDQIVNTSPALQKLHLHLDPYESSIHDVDVGLTGRSFSKGIRNFLNSNLIGPLRQLTELMVVLGDDSTYKALSLHQFLSLEKLKITFLTKMSTASGNILNSFLTIQNCPVLSSLHFCFLYNHFELYEELSSHDEVRGGFPPEFTTLPNITHFALSYAEAPRSLDSGSPSAFIQIDHLTSTNFPNLSSVTIMFGVHFYYSPAFLGYDPDAEEDEIHQWRNNPALLNHVTFDKVSRLTLIVDRVINGDSDRYNDIITPIFRDDATNQLHLLFPNVKELVIDNQIRPDEQSLQEVKGIILSCLAEIPQLKSLTITNYIQDWLCEHLVEENAEAETQIKSQLQSLKSLILPPIQKQYKEIIKTSGKSIGYASRITHAKVTYDGLPLFNTSSSDSIIVHNRNFGQMIDNISSQLHSMMAKSNVEDTRVQIQPTYTKTYSEDLALIIKCLDMIAYVEKDTGVGALAFCILNDLQDVNESANDSRIVHDLNLNPCLDLKTLMTILPGLGEIQVSEEFVINAANTSSNSDDNRNNVFEIIEEFKNLYPQLAIKVV